MLARCPISTPPIRLKIQAREQNYGFAYANEGGRGRRSLKALMGAF